VSRRIGRRNGEVFEQTEGQLLKLHTQTSGRSLIAAEFKNNLIERPRIGAGLHERHEFMFIPTSADDRHHAK